MTAQHTPEPWIQDIELECTFEVDGRTETVIEITNLDHSATFAYAVPEFAHIVAAAPELLVALDKVLTAIDFTEDGMAMQDEILVAEDQIRAAVAKAKP